MLATDVLEEISEVGKASEFSILSVNVPSDALILTKYVIFESKSLFENKIFCHVF